MYSVFFTLLHSYYMAP